MRTRMAKILFWYLIISIVGVGCSTLTPSPTITPVSFPTQVSQLPEGCPPQCSHAILHGTWLNGQSSLNGVDFSGADLSGADISNAYWDNAILQGANLIGANLSETSLVEADLSHANLTNANLWDAALREANLTGANLENATMNGVALQGANLEGAILDGANMTAADLWSGASLRGASLRGTILSMADLRLADLRGADLSNADLSNAVLDESVYNNETVWPDGFDPVAAGAILESDIPVNAPTSLTTTANTPPPSESMPTLIPNSYSPGAIGDYTITKITINEPSRLLSFSIKNTLVEIEASRYRVTAEIVDGNPPENFSLPPESWINFSDLPVAYDRRSIGETWTESSFMGTGPEVSLRRLENETVKIGNTSFDATVVEITPTDESMRWKIIEHLAYDAPITPIIRTLQISWEIGPSGGNIMSNVKQDIIEIGQASK